MSRYRKRPVEVDAIRFTGQNTDELVAFSEGKVVRRPYAEYPYINSGTGVLVIAPGDWVIRGMKGEYYLCFADAFDGIYEPVAEEAHS